MSDVDIDSEILYTCNGCDECKLSGCHHKTTHTRNAGCGIPCAGGMPGAICTGDVFYLKIGKKRAQELLNVITMAAGEGCEFEFTEELAKKLGEFIDGGV